MTRREKEQESKKPDVEVSEAHPLTILYGMMLLYLGWDLANSKAPDVVPMPFKMHKKQIASHLVYASRIAVTPVFPLGDIFCLGLDITGGRESTAVVPMPFGGGSEVILVGGPRDYP